MTVAVEEVRAMLALFAASPWRYLHLRSGQWEMFFAKPGGAANPMVNDRDAGIVIDDAALDTIDAPHLGLFVAGLAPGDPVAPGTVVARIEVLGEAEDIVATQNGRVAAVLADDGALVEYGMPLIRLAA